MNTLQRFDQRYISALQQARIIPQFLGHNPRHQVSGGLRVGSNNDFHKVSRQNYDDLCITSDCCSNEILCKAFMATTP